MKNDPPAGPRLRPAVNVSPGRSLAAAALLAAGLITLAVGAPDAASGAQQGAPLVVESVDLGGLDARSAALVLSGMEAGDLPLEVAATALPGASAGGSRSLLVVVETAGEALLLAAGGAGELVGELYVYALSSHGRLHDARTRAFRLDLGRHAEALRAHGLELFTTVQVPPGDTSLRVLLLHRASGRLGLRVVSHAVPAASVDEGEGAAIDAPLFAETAAGRLVVAAVGPELSTALFTAAVLPTADARVASGTSPWLWLPVSHAANRWAEALVRSDDATNSTSLPLAGAQVSSTEPGLGVRLGALDLLPGAYRLRVRTGGGRDSRERAFVLLPRDGDADGHGAAAPEAVLAADEAAERTLATRAALVAYRDALAPPGARARDWNPDVLAAFESRIRGGAEARRLLAAQLQAAESLARHSAEGLVPLLHLHGLLYPVYLERERYDAARHAGALVRRLAELYAESSRDPERNRIAAAALASLGGHRHEAGAELEARSVYLAALELDGEQTAALLGAACVHESFGDYRTAVELLRRARRSGPGVSEVRLRLAINELRLGADRRALDSLRELAAGVAPEWISLLAYQELARATVAQGRLDEADGLLAEALEKHPADQRLLIQRIAVLDRLRRSAEAREALARIDPEAGTSDTPRLRYSGPPSTALEAARRLVATAAAERREEALRGLRRLAPEHAP